jgi:hypothetical protein
MQPSRFRDQNTLDPKRFKDFVGLDCMTAQLPLIEVLVREKRIRIWVSYDLARICGTFIDCYFNGLVVTTTRYASGRTVDKIVRPEDKHDTKRKPARLRAKSKSGSKNRRSTKAKKVHGRKKYARAKKQSRIKRAVA